MGSLAVGGSLTCCLLGGAARRSWFYSCDLLVGGSRRVMGKTVAGQNKETWGPYVHNEHILKVQLIFVNKSILI